MKHGQEIRISNMGTGKNIRVYFPCTDEELNAAAAAIGINEAIPYATIWIPDVREPALKYLDGMKVNLDELNYFIKRMDSLAEDQCRKVRVYADEKRIGNLKDLINLTFSDSEIFLLSDFSDLKKLGKQLYLEKHGAMTKAEEESIDFAKFAEDIIQGGTKTVTKYGVLIDEGSVNELYDGRLFPEYLYDPNEIVVNVQVKNQYGEVQHLFLPADICSVDKVKARLGVERLSECSFEFYTLQLPEQIMRMLTDIKSAEELTYVNEFCQTVKRFTEEQMTQLQMAAELMNVRSPTGLTALAGKLKSFEIHPGIHDIEQYGRHIAFEVGQIDADSVLIPFIDYGALGQNRLNELSALSGFVENGFVIAKEDIREALAYRGEYASYLELPEGKLLTLRLFSPLVATEYSSEDGVYNDRIEHDGYSLAEFEDEIRESIRKAARPGESARGLMTYFHESRDVAGKVIEARPDVECYHGELYGVLNCKLREALTEGEYEELVDFWCGQQSDGWGEGFEQREIVIGSREICVSFWNADGRHFIKTESELKGTEQEQGSEMFHNM